MLDKIKKLAQSHTAFEFLIIHLFLAKENQLITTIQSPQQTDGTVKLLDLLGRTRAVIFDGVLGENSTSFITNISSLESSLYLLNVTTPQGSFNERIVITH